MNKWWIGAIICFGLIVCVAHGQGGSGADPIHESEIVATIHVDAAAAPGGDGSVGAPFNDLQTAFNHAINQYNANEQGVRVRLAPGTYRPGTPGGLNAISFPTPTTDAPVVVEGAGWSPGTHSGDVIITGSEEWTDWTNNGDGTWSKHWPYKWGVGPNNTGGGNPPEPVLRYELVHVNGETYYQVLGADDPHLNNLTAYEGAFWVNEDTELITIRPPDGFGSLDDALVEVSTRRRLLHHWRPQAHTSPTRVAFRNLVFQHGTGGMNSGAVMLQNMIGLWVEDCVFRNNKQMGVTIAGIHSVFTMRDTDIIYNGEMGAGFQGVNILVERSRFNHNARFADVVQYYGWGYGGIKVGASRDTTFLECEFNNNYGMGLWFDTACVGMLVENCIIVENTSQGLWNENNNRNNVAGLGRQPTVTVRNTYIAENYRRTPQAHALGGGFYITESENTVIEYSVLYGNHVQFRVSDGPGRGPIDHTTVRHSILAGNQETPQNIYAIGYGTVGWPQFFNTLTDQFDHNAYYFPGITADGDIESPQPRPAITKAFYRVNQAMVEDLAGWQALHAGKGAEQNSIWITDYHGQPLVTVDAVAEYRQETGGTVDGFVVRRATRDTSEPLVVNYAAQGTAVPGTHYEAFPGSITIPAGAFSAIIPFTPIETGTPFGEHSVGIQVTASANYATTLNEASFILEDQGAAGQPRVSVVATTPNAYEEGRVPGVFTLYRTGSLDDPLTVNFSLGGSAASSRYVDPGITATFDAGSATAAVLIFPIDDDIPQLTETVTLTIEVGAGYIPALDAPTTATITLFDNDIAQPIHVTMQPTDDPLNAVIQLHNPDPTQSQTFTITFPLSDGYTWQDSTQPGGPEFEWVEIRDGAHDSTRTLAVSRTMNGISGALPIGFPFPFYGDEHTHFHLAAGGVLYFGTEIPTFFLHTRENELLPSNALVFNNRTNVKSLAVFWTTDLFEGGDTLLSGEPNPNAGSSWYANPDEDTFIFQWQDHTHRVDFPNRKLTMQARLHRSGEIILAYKEFNLPFQLGGTVGIQDKGLDDPDHLNIAHNTDYIQPGMAIRILPSVPWLQADEQVVQVTIPPGSSESVNFMVDPSLLSLDTYNAHLTITSDHPDQPTLNLPVTLIVSDTSPLPPSILNADDFDPEAGQPFYFPVRIDREIRATFDEAEGPDAGIGSAGAGWTNAWTIYATDWETMSDLQIEDETPFFPGAGQYLQLSGTALGAGKRVLVGRSYNNDGGRRINRAEPHRLVIHLRADDLENFTDTNDRLYLWDRLDPSNAAHFSDTATMTWGFDIAGTIKTWRSYSPTRQDTGIALKEGHVYRFIIDVDPAENRWRFTLSDLTDDAHYTSPGWQDFRNASEEPGAVGGHIHAGMFLQTAPQTAVISLDEIRITPLDLTFSASNLPDGVVLDEAAGVLRGELVGDGSFLVSVGDLYGVNSSVFTYGEGEPFIDTSGSGADDAWEMAVFGNLDNEPVEIDGRWYTRRQLFFWNMPDPLNEVFRMDGFRFPTVTGRHYRVQHNVDLRAGDWVEMGELIVGHGGDELISDPDPGFYRVRVLLP